MSIHDEPDVRAALGNALDELTPGPLPLGDVLRQGRRVKVRRRATVAGTLVVIVALAVGVAPLTHHLALGSPRPAAPRYHVTVDPPGHGTARGLVASGTVNGKPWQVVGRLTHHPLGVSFVMPQVSAWDAAGRPPGPGNDGDLAGASGAGIGSPPEATTHIISVRKDVAYLRMWLTNGQTIELHPVPVFGAGYAPWVAFAVPSSADVTRVAAYSGHGELGYAIPFTADGNFTVARWLKPGQAALPRPASRLIGAGVWAGQRWSARVYVGPWGVCLSQGGGSGCPGDHLRHSPAAENTLSGGGPGGSTIAVITTTPAVTRLVITHGQGSTSVARLVRLGDAGYAAVIWGPRDRAIRFTAYSATGHRLATGTLRSI